MKRKTTTPTTVSAIVESKSPYRIHIRIEGGLPQSANAYRNKFWKANHAHALLWKTRIAKAVYLQRPERPLESFKVTAIRSVPRFFDYDNAVTSLKAILDGLKGMVIADDNYERTGPWEVSQNKRLKKEGPPMIDLWITENP